MSLVDTSRYQPVTDRITRKLKALLGCPVLVVNGDGVIVASSEPDLAGAAIDTIVSSNPAAWLSCSLPFECDARPGRVFVRQEGLPGQEVARLTTALVEMVVNEALMAGSQPVDAEYKNKFVSDVVHGRIEDPDILQRQAQILGMDLSQPRSVILIDARDYISPSDASSTLALETSQLRARQRAKFIISSTVGFFELPNDNICAYLGEGEVIVLKSISRQTLQRWSDSDEATVQDAWVDMPALHRAAGGLLTRLQNDTRASISIGIGRHHAGVDGLSRSYNDAHSALAIGRRYYGPDRVYSIDNLGLAAFVLGTDGNTKRDLAAHLLDPLQNNAELTQTLTTYFQEACCPSATAARLSVHRNTVSHRLQKIRTLVGLDPRDFEDAVQLRLALLVQSLPEF